MDLINLIGMIIIIEIWAYAESIFISFSVFFRPNRRIEICNLVSRFLYFGYFELEGLNFSEACGLGRVSWRTYLRGCDSLLMIQFFRDNTVFWIKFYNHVAAPRSHLNILSIRRQLLLILIRARSASTIVEPRQVLTDTFLSKFWTLGGTRGPL